MAAGNNDHHAMRRTPRGFSRAAAAGLACAVGLLVCGCRNDRQVIHGEAFPADDEPRTVDRFIDVQSAAAARVDATLTAAHFDVDGGVNSLGRQKLDLMVRGGEAGGSTLIVYLDVRENSAAGSGSTRPASLARHEEAVLAYLADEGIDGQNVQVRVGPNLRYTRPAEDGLRGLRRLEDQGEATSGNGAAAAKGSSEGNLSGLFPGGDK